MGSRGPAKFAGGIIERFGANLPHDRVELLGLGVLVTVFERLDAGERRRALAYLSDRFGSLDPPPPAAEVVTPSPKPEPAALAALRDAVHKLSRERDRATAQYAEARKALHEVRERLTAVSCSAHGRTIVEHREGTGYEGDCTLPPPPWTAATADHRPRCGQCEMYAETGMHWDTCPNRGRNRKPRVAPPDGAGRG